MSGGVRVLRAESRSEGIDVRQSASEGFPFELSAHCQISRLAKEISLRLLVDVALESRYAKHFAGSLAIAGGNNRRVDVHKIPLLKKLVHRKGQLAAHPKHRAVHIRARPQVRDRPQKLLSVAFLLKRVRWIRRAQ